MSKHHSNPRSPYPTLSPITENLRFFCAPPNCHQFGGEDVWTAVKGVGGAVKGAGKVSSETAEGVQRSVSAEGPKDALELAERSIGPGREGIETEVGRQAVEESGVGAGNAPYEPPPFIAPGGQGSADLPGAGGGGAEDLVVGGQASVDIGDPHSAAMAVADAFGGVGHDVVGAVNTAFGAIGDTFWGITDAAHQHIM